MKTNGREALILDPQPELHTTLCRMDISIACTTVSELTLMAENYHEHIQTKPRRRRSKNTDYSVVVGETCKAQNIGSHTEI